MGNLIWHEYARYVAIAANACECAHGPRASYPRVLTAPSLPPQDAIWGAFWGIYYRKFFFDFLHGIVRAPGGVQ